MFDFLEKFEKRMEWIGIAVSIINRKGKVTKLEGLFKENELTNIIISVLLFIMEKTLEENKELKKQIAEFEKDKVKFLKKQLKNNVKEINGINVIAEKVDVNNAGQIKDMAFQLKSEIDNLFFVAGANINGKVNLTIIISDNLVKDKSLNAGQIIREIAKEVKGGGGGQAAFASAGGSDASGIEKALKMAVEFIS